MLGFLDSLFTVALPLIVVISIVLGLIISVIGGVVYLLVRSHVEQSINDLQGHHIRR